MVSMKTKITGAKAVEINPMRKRGLTRKQVILLPRYSPRRPPRRQVSIVAKVDRLAERYQQSVMNPSNIGLTKP